MDKISEIFVDVEREEYERDYKKFQIKAIHLKVAFNDFKSFFTSNALNRTFKVIIKDSKMSLFVDTFSMGSVDINILDYDSKLDGEYYYLYEDIAELLPGKGNLDIILTKGFLRVEGKKIKVTMYKSETFVDTFDIPKIPPVTIDANLIRRGLNSLTSMSAIQKVFGNNAIIQMVKDCMCIHYPYVDVQCTSVAIETALSLTTAGVLKKFLANVDIVDIYQTQSRVLIKADNRCISIAKTAIEGFIDVRDEMKKLDYIGDVRIIGATNKLKSINKSMGTGLVTMNIYNNRLLIRKDNDISKSGAIVALVESPRKVSSEDDEYDDNDNIEEESIPDKFLTTIVFNIEFMINILSVIGEVFKLYRRGRVLCMETADVLVMFTSRD